MEKALKIMTLEVKRKGFIKGLLLSFAAAILMISLTVLCLKGDTALIPSSTIRISAYITLVLVSYSLTQEFSNKTDKIIFTGVFTRNQIIISKLISFIVISIISFLFFEITSVIFNTFDSKMLIENFTAFLIYGFTVGSFILMISAITSSFLITGIMTYVLYFDLILVLLSQALYSTKSAIIKLIIKNLPFYIANSGFYIGHYTLNQSIIMIISGFLFLGITCIIINKRSI